VIRVALLCSFSFFAINAFAQEANIPLGAWRLHLNYSTIKSLAEIDGKVYGAADFGVMSFDPQEGSTGSLNKLNGLSGIGVNCLASDELNGILVIGYQDGTIDFLEGNKITNLETLKIASEISGSRSINNISISGNTAYASTDFGVVVLDIKKKEIRETWRDLGTSGQTIRIRESAILKDSIFLATESGIWAGSLKSNLLDFNNWKKFNSGVFSSGVNVITVYNNSIYTAVNGLGIFRKQRNNWMKESFLQNLTYTKLKGMGLTFFVCSKAAFWQIDSNGIVTEIKSELLTQPNDVLENGGNLFIGDNRNGLLLSTSNSMNSFKAPGPILNSFWRIVQAQNMTYAIGGGYTQSLSPLTNNGNVSVFASDWSNATLPIGDITDLDHSNSSEAYYSSFGKGIIKQNSELAEFNYTTTNSPLQSNYVTAIERVPAGLWIANYNAAKPLQLLLSDGSWESYSFPFLLSRFPVDLIVDLNDNVWMPISATDGGGLVVFNRNSNKSVYLTDQGGQGGLPSKKVSSIAVDREGLVWVGTEQGVAFFSSPSAIFDGNVNATKPIYDNRFLLRDEKITAFAIDGGNRKWIGTGNGVWLFDPLGEKLIYNFNTNNSPLLSSIIQCIGINNTTGEVFFGTDKGLASFRSDATAGALNFDSVKIFPNPVTAQFNGVVGIEGLTIDSIVKITDISGKLVWQVMANGGTASWNMRDANGRRVATGVYLVFSTSADGLDRNVGKIAIVE
jgi:hypothetical protein